jgi:hypothetical protein
LPLPSRLPGEATPFAAGHRLAGTGPFRNHRKTRWHSPPLEALSASKVPDPLIADDRNFYKVEKWTKDGQRIEYMLYDWQPKDGSLDPVLV